MSLPLITSLARTGALEQAWRLFREGGYDARTNDPAALSVKGRLLKDEGLRLAGGARAAKLVEAAAAYAAANAVEPAPYLAINGATLRLLGGDAAAAASLARDVLAQLDGKSAIAETPYWLAATRAEALLLLGETDAAAAALARARTLSPDNWEGQASTIRQIGLILDALGAPQSWLDPHRPPRTLHYAGHLGVAADDVALRKAVEAWLARESVGFGHGALAAGSDIIIAEALIARGAELHVHLPVGRAAFIDQSVHPYGADWVRRFETCSAAATSVHEETGLSGEYEPCATSLAADIAMGAAALQARNLCTEAVQLLVLDDGPGPLGDGTATARDAQIWAAAGRRQHMIRTPRTTGVAASALKQEGRADRALFALISVAASGIDLLGEDRFAAELDAWLAAWWAKLDGLAPDDAYRMSEGHRRIFGFETPAAALEFVSRVRALETPQHFPVTIAGHYALAHRHMAHLAGPALVQLQSLADGTPPGATLITRQLATALAILSAAMVMEPWGDLAGQPLYALS